ncbi:hypothetical protein [Falsiroseomonas sp.]|uniref:hypothetical protein n=1 Tax=Falsiroseomonas sp. TaxID=2870721 RepID=UPI00271BA3A1|nr:hypothetical protein [Falsiroseomonas sp.]MDO9502147.1 hypothetical protein [Falsiroseomonas sp.]
MASGPRVTDRSKKQVEPSRPAVRFHYEDGNVVWYVAEGAELTIQEADVIGRIRGMHDLAKAVEALADAVRGVVLPMSAED